MADTLRVPLSRLLPYLDRQALFVRRWQMVNPKATPAQRAEQTAKASATFHALWNAARRQRLFSPRAVFGFYQATLPHSGDVTLSGDMTRPGT